MHKAYIMSVFYDIDPNDVEKGTVVQQQLFVVEANTNDSLELTVWVDQVVHLFERRRVYIFEDSFCPERLKRE